jgi:hypothetical protein
MEWKFDFERDNKGYLVSVHAMAVAGKLTIN